ncbi:MAG: hypothetical protein U9Q77_01585 [Candidatus Marinimicrobia bacterium]|nr:hypothetical protein [Candidatus Neomarinimicrobiota bacterium]
MLRQLRPLTFWIILMQVLSVSLLYGGAEDRRTGIHDGNLVYTRYSNYGNLGDRYENPRMEWPKGSGMVYGFEFIMIAAAEVEDINGDPVKICSESYSHPVSHDISPDGTHLWNWQPLDGYFNKGAENSDEYPAMSHKAETWPLNWPYDYPGDQGSRDGLWNGEFGAYTRADQESYYVMDDRDNDEFEYYPFIGSSVDSAGYPNGRRGLGFEVKVRGYEWAAVEAEDILIVRYDIANVSDKNLETVVFGMYVDAMVGGTSDNPDYARFDQFDDITYCWDFDGIDNRGIPGLGYFGYAFLESPGDPLNGIDDDENGLIDERQDNDRGEYIFGPIGNYGDPKNHWSGDEDGDWRIYEDFNGNGIWDMGEAILDDVGNDGIGPYDQDYPGPDSDQSEANGVPDPGEPNFGKQDNDESDQIGLTSVILLEPQSLKYDDRTFNQMTPGLFTYVDPANLAFMYGSGYFSLPKDETRKFAIANLFGTDEQDIFRNKRTMQRIYDADYNFAKPPLKPVLTAVAGDAKVILKWDHSAERSIDPIYGKDFEGYLIYRSTDPSFNEIKTITDAYGSPIFWKPLAQFDLVNDLAGPHPVEITGTGAHFYIGDNTDLEYFYEDLDVQNGRTYYYAVCSFDKGYDEDFYDRGIVEADLLASIAPVECTKIIQTDSWGDIKFVDRNCAVVVPNAPSAGYIPGKTSDVEHIGLATGAYDVSVMVPDSIADDHEYEITFTDTTLGRYTASVSIHDLTDDVLIHHVTPYDEFVLSSEIIKGMQFDLFNDSAEVAETKWLVGNSNIEIETELLWSPKSIPLPEDFEIRVYTANTDTSYNPLIFLRTPVNFQVWNTTRNEQWDFEFSEAIHKDSTLNGGDRIVIVFNAQGFLFNTAWEFYFRDDTSMTDVIIPQPGDVFSLTVTKPFNSDDTLRFSTTGSKMSTPQATDDMDNIYVVPDPYVVTASWEKPLFYASGRGERRIDFVNLPQECTIRIFTMSGKLVRTLEHSSTMTQGTESWDLISRDGLSVSFGMYIFQVEAEGIGSKVGKFALIK